MKKIYFVLIFLLSLVVLVSASVVYFSVSVNDNFLITNGSSINLRDYGQVGYGVSNVTATRLNQTWLEFDGEDDYVTSTKIINNSNSLTYCAWVNRTSWSEKVMIFIDGDNWFNFDSGNQTRLYVPDCVDTTLYSSAGHQSDSFQHVCVVLSEYDGYASFYFDGVLDNTDDHLGCDMSNTRIFSLGGRIENDANLTGQLDNILIYNKPLTAYEINKIYNRGIDSFNNSFTINKTNLPNGISRALDINDSGTLYIFNYSAGKF